MKIPIEFPMDARLALIRLEPYLHPLEKEELTKLKKVYYFNILLRKSGKAEPSSTHNHGYDDKDGHYMYH